MRIKIPVLTASALLLAAAFSSVRTEARDAGAAVITVGQGKIRRGQVDTLVALMIKARHLPGEIGSKEKASLEKMVATNLIGQELIELEAQRLKVKAENREIDSMYRVLRVNYPNDAAFRTALAAAGDSEKSLREKLARQIRSDKILNGQVPAVERPSVKEMKDYYEKHKSVFPVHDSLRACQIMLLAEKGGKASDLEAKRARLENLRRELSADSADPYLLLRKFVTKAGSVSEGPERKEGGDLGRFRPDDFNPEFKKQVLRLKVGGLSPVFKTPLGWHLLLLTEKFDGKYESYAFSIPRMLMAEKAAETGKNLKKYLRSLATRYKVNYLEKSLKDSSEMGVY